MPAENMPADVQNVLNQYPKAIQDGLTNLRDIILDVAATTPGVGPLNECLKWGQPAYLTDKTKSGTTVRIDRDETNGGDFALYVNCKTNLVATWRDRYPELTYGGDRSVHFSTTEPLPVETVRHLIAMALTYHRDKR